MEIKYLNADGEKISKHDDLEFGKDNTPVSDSDNLLSAHSLLNKKGFDLFVLKKSETFTSLEKHITDYVFQKLSSYQKTSSDFDLKKYHRYLTSEETHYKISTWALDYREFGNTFYEVLHHAEETLQLKLKVKTINHQGVKGEYVGFRILRPQKNDHNPLHRDSWVEYWRNTVNIWLPICGFENGNSLQLIPQSHLWSDDQILKTKAGVQIDGKKYHVPAAIGTVNKFSIETPVLKKGEGIIFSPYLIHGNGVNKEPDTTRVSLEFRFCKK